MSFKNKVKDELFKNIPPNFVDPITNHIPSNEVQLSSLLGMFHHKGLINWNKINLYNTDNSPSGKLADSIISKSGTLNCEWPLFAETVDEISIWGTNVR